MYIPIIDSRSLISKRPSLDSQDFFLVFIVTSESVRFVYYRKIYIVVSFFVM